MADKVNNRNTYCPLEEQAVRSVILIQHVEGGTQTCHSSDDSGGFDEVSDLHVLCSDEPPLPASPCHQSNVCRPFQ